MKSSVTNNGRDLVTGTAAAPLWLLTGFSVSIAISVAVVVRRLVASGACDRGIMVDGAGMCGGCRVAVGGKVRFACIDGPEFDAHEVDFDELARRWRPAAPRTRRRPGGHWSVGWTTAVCASAPRRSAPIAAD